MAYLVGQKGQMSRSLIFLMLGALLIIGGAILLSNNAREVPVKPIEAEVSNDSASR